MLSESCCGDGECDPNEEVDCSCEADCGPCDCTELPDSPVPNISNTGFQFNFASPKILGTGANITLKVTVSASGEANAAECTGKVAANVLVSGCVSVAFQNTCVSTGGGASGTCTSPLGCEEPPAYFCDTEKECCVTDVTAGASFGRTFSPKRKFGVFECSISLGGPIGVSGNTSFSDGPGCACADQITAGLAINGALTGGAQCKVNVFGHLVSVGAKATAKACAGGQVKTGCVEEINPVGKASFTISIPTTVIGVLVLPSFSEVFQIGGGC